MHNKGHTRAIGCRQVCNVIQAPDQLQKKEAKQRVSVVTQGLDQESGNNAREVVFIEENIVVSRLACAKQTCVAVEVVIAFNWAHNIRVYDCARATVPIIVTVAIGTREEDNFVGFSDDNKSDCGVEIESCTCAYGLAVVSRRGISLGERTRGKGERDETDFG